MKSGLLYSPLHSSTLSGLLVVNRADASAAAIATNAEPESRVQKFCTRLPLKLSPPSLSLIFSFIPIEKQAPSSDSSAYQIQT